MCACARMHACENVFKNMGKKDNRFCLFSKVKKKQKQKLHFKELKIFLKTAIQK